MRTRNDIFTLSWQKVMKNTIIYYYTFQQTHTTWRLTSITEQHKIILQTSNISPFHVNHNQTPNKTFTEYWTWYETRCWASWLDCVMWLMGSQRVYDLKTRLARPDLVLSPNSPRNFQLSSQFVFTVCCNFLGTENLCDRSYLVSIFFIQALHISNTWSSIPIISKIQINILKYIFPYCGRKYWEKWHNWLTYTPQTLKTVHAFCDRIFHWFYCGMQNKVTQIR